MVRTGRFAEAYELLTKSYGPAPTDSGVSFLLGRCAYELGRPSEAIVHYRAILVREPGSARVRAELGKAYLANGQQDQALSEFRAVLATNPPHHVRDDLLALVAAAEGLGVWTTRAAIGYMHDSNANVGPSATSISIFGIPFELTPASAPQPDSAVRASLATNHVAVFSNTLAWQSDLSVDLTDYSVLNRFDNLQMTVTTGPTWRATASLFSVPLLLEYSDLGHSKYFHTYGLAPQLEHAIAEGLSVKGAAVALRREFTADPDRTGLTWAASISLRKATAAEGDYLEMTYRHIAEGTKFDFLDNRTDSLALTWHGANWAGFSIDLEPSVSSIRYLEREAIFESARQDTRSSLSANVLRRFLSDKLTIAAGYTVIRNRSNIAINEYERRLVTLQLSRVF